MMFHFQLMMPLYYQGFKDTSLTVWKASCILRNYELRTGKTISHEDLDAGTLAGKFVDADYQLDESVSYYLLLLSFYACIM